MGQTDAEKVVLQGIGAESFRHVRKDMLMNLFEELSGFDAQAASRVLDQIPNLSKLATGALADNALAFQDTVAANDASQARAHEFLRAHQQTFLDMLARGVGTPEERSQMMADLRELNLQVLKVHADDQNWLSDLSDSRMMRALGVVAGVAVVAIGAAKGGGGQAIPAAVSRMLSAARS